MTLPNWHIVQLLFEQSTQHVVRLHFSGWFERSLKCCFTPLLQSAISSISGYEVLHVLAPQEAVKLLVFKGPVNLFDMCHIWYGS